jgi:hypothetical protein
MYWSLRTQEHGCQWRPVSRAVAIDQLFMAGFLTLSGATDPLLYLVRATDPLPKVSRRFLLNTTNYLNYRITQI